MIALLARMALLTPYALTVRAQTVSPTDDGKLLWDQFFPRKDVLSVNLKDVYATDFRPATDRRAWNARGRHVPLKTPSQRNVSITPIEGYATINEQEMNELLELARQTNDVQETLLNLIGARLPDRVKAIAQGNYRRFELDAFESWFKGTITQRNPQNSEQTYTASWKFDVSRIQAAAQPLNAAGVNAWNENLAWLEDAHDAIGTLSGEMMRRSTWNAIRADAPKKLNGEEYSTVDLEAIIQDRLSTDFQFFLNDRTVDVFTDGGDATTRQKVIPFGGIAAIPAGEVIGDGCFAPVGRADDLDGFADDSADVTGSGDDAIDPTGNRVFYSKENNGKTATAEVQLNGLAVPQEANVFTLDAKC